MIGRVREIVGRPCVAVAAMVPIGSILDCEKVTGIALCSACGCDRGLRPQYLPPKTAQYRAIVRHITQCYAL